MTYRTILVLPALLSLALLSLLVGAEPEKDKGRARPVRLSTDPKDWPTYNHDVVGTRHNTGEKKLGKDNVAKLVEKWRFPARLSLNFVGVIHATPVVVNGYVYFGTATLPTVYKLGPDGKLKWSFRSKAAKKETEKVAGVPDSGFLNSPLVTNDTVYIAEVGGMIYALDRATGKERWSVNTRAKPFPGAHPSNCLFAAPILADGKIIVAGGGYEHAVAANPLHRCCTGRGFVAALLPGTGKVVWKYDVGPEPKPLDPPVKIKDAWGEHVFHFGPSTSSVWCTPSYDAATRLLFFGTDAHNAPRQPTADDPRLYTRYSCAVIAIDVRTGAEKWLTQINKGDVWNYALRAYDPKTGLYKDQSIGDTPKLYTIDVAGKPTRVVGAGCKNGGFYVLDAATGKIHHHTPVYTGAPALVPKPAPHPRTLALPGPIGGLQTGCATDGRSIYTNGIDSMLAGTSAERKDRWHPPTGGRVVSISLDTGKENWRHERPKVKAVGGTKDKPAFTNVGDPVASGIALANGVAYFTTTVSNKLVALDTASGKVLKEIALGPVWCGPSVSRGRVFVGTGNILFAPFDSREAYFPKRLTGTLYSFGLPGKDEMDEMGKGDE
jgi:polyvinyl alcohol dehydrogenase (cytochrome)